MTEHGKDLLTQEQCADLLAYHVARAQEVLIEQERTIAVLEKQNRKLNDKLNRFRNMTPGRKRLHTLRRVAVMLEAEANFAERKPKPPPNVVAVDYAGLRVDALYLHRLQWDFEQLREVVYPSKQPAHEWRRP